MLTSHPSSPRTGMKSLTLSHVYPYPPMSSMASIIHWSSCLLIVFLRFVCVRVGTSFWLVLVLQRVLSFCRCSKCMISTRCCIWLSQIQLTPFLGVKNKRKVGLLQHTLYNQPTKTTSYTTNSFLLLHCLSSDWGPLSEVIGVWVCTLTLWHHCACAPGSIPWFYAPSQHMGFAEVLCMWAGPEVQKVFMHSSLHYCSTWKCRLEIVITSWANYQNLCTIKKRNREIDWFLLVISTVSEI